MVYFDTGKNIMSFEEMIVGNGKNKKTYEFNSVYKLITIEKNDKQEIYIQKGSSKFFRIVLHDKDGDNVKVENVLFISQGKQNNYSYQKNWNIIKFLINKSYFITAIDNTKNVYIQNVKVVQLENSNQPTPSTSTSTITELTPEPQTTLAASSGLVSAATPLPAAETASPSAPAVTATAATPPVAPSAPAEAPFIMNPDSYVQNYNNSGAGLAVVVNEENGYDYNFTIKILIFCIVIVLISIAFMKKEFLKSYASKFMSKKGAAAAASTSTSASA